MSKLPKVSIIVLNWNRLMDTSECLETLQKVEYENKEIIVVDNGSSNGSQDYIRRNYHDIMLVENTENLGFAEGNNKGIQLALRNGADYVFLLNNDTIVDRNVIEELIEVAETDILIGFLGPKIYYYNEPNRIWSAGGDYQNGLFKAEGNTLVIDK